ncbi:MAG TPA: hypothetical protein PLU80_09220 [Acidobacteriota bacterium]|nr:hypothetical protein [Acidobacteriota bacterium]
MNSQEIITLIQSLPVQEQMQIIIAAIENLAKPVTRSNLNQKAETEVRNQLKREIIKLLSFLDEITAPTNQPIQLPVSTDEQERQAMKRQQRHEWKETYRTQYAGKYIALDGNRLLGVGNNYVEARKAAIQAGVKDAYIDYMQSLDEEIFMGGW